MSTQHNLPREWKIHEKYTFLDVIHVDIGNVPTGPKALPYANNILFTRSFGRPEGLIFAFTTPKIITEEN